MGQGTQRVEAALAGEFVAARVLRIDRDSTRRRDAWTEMRGRITRREVDILVGTQILAKGHDFPHLNLVGVVNADALLYSADVRAAERLYALLTQVAGRAGRGDIRGTVLIQTEFPGHPLYEALKRHDYRAFADGLLAERRQAGFPPFVHQALLRAEAPQLGVALEFLGAAARRGARARHAGHPVRPGAGDAAAPRRTLTAPSCWCNPNRAPACSASCRPGADSCRRSARHARAGRSMSIRSNSERRPCPRRDRITAPAVFDRRCSGAGSC